MNKGKLLLAVVAGAAAGAAIGILFAQDSGAETRKKIRRSVEDLTDAINRKGKHMWKDVKENLHV